MAKMTMDEARAYAVQCWCEPSTSAIEMDMTLLEIFAKRLMGVAKRAQLEKRERCAETVRTHINLPSSTPGATITMKIRSGEEA